MSINKEHKSRPVLQCVVFSAVVLSGAFMSAADENARTTTKLVVDFDSETVPWRSVDDSVMGGVSSSRMRLENGTAVFEGELSLENNGGFASVRSGILEIDLEGFEGVRLRVKGDGQKYQFRIRSNSDFDGPSHQMTFETKNGAWIEVDLAFSEFVAAYRGRQLPNHPPIDSGEVATMGFLIADNQAGNFRLEIDWIQAYQSVEDSDSDE